MIKEIRTGYEKLFFLEKSHIKKKMEKFFRQILENPQLSSRVRMKNEKGETVLIYYLKKNRTQSNSEIIPTVQKLIRLDVPTNVIDDEGVCALTLLISRMSSHGDMWDEKIRSIVSMAKNPPLSVMTQLCSKYLALKKHHLDRNNPIRRLVCVLIRKFDFNKVVHAVKNQTYMFNNYDFVEDIIRCTPSDIRKPSGMKMILEEAIANSVDEKHLLFLARFDAPIDYDHLYILTATSYPNAFIAFFPQHPDKKNQLLKQMFELRVLHGWSLSSPPFLKIFDFLVKKHNATLHAPDIMHTIIMNNEMYIVKSLIDYGSPVTLPPEAPPKKKKETYDMVRQTLERRAFFRTLSQKNFNMKKRRKPTADTFDITVAKRVVKMKPDMVRQLSQMIGR